MGVDVEVVQLELGTMYARLGAGDFDAAILLLPEMTEPNVLRHFQDAQQFNDWLNTSSDELDKHSPLDVLAEAGGVSRLTALVGKMRRKTPGA